MRTNSKWKKKDVYPALEYSPPCQKQRPCNKESSQLLYRSSVPSSLWLINSEQYGICEDKIILNRLYCVIWTHLPDNFDSCTLASRTNILVYEASSDGKVLVLNSLYCWRLIWRNMGPPNIWDNSLQVLWWVWDMPKVDISKTSNRFLHAEIKRWELATNYFLETTSLLTRHSQVWHCSIHTWPLE